MSADSSSPHLPPLQVDAAVLPGSPCVHSPRFSPKHIAGMPHDEILQEYFGVGSRYRRADKAIDHANLLRKTHPDWAQRLLDGFYARHGGIPRSYPAWYVPHPGIPPVPEAPTRNPQKLTLTTLSVPPAAVPVPEQPAAAVSSATDQPAVAPAPSAPPLSECQRRQAERRAAIEDLVTLATNIRTLLTRYTGLPNLDRLTTALDRVRGIASFLASPQTAPEFAENRAVLESLVHEIPIARSEDSYYSGSPPPWPEALPDGVIIGADGRPIGTTPDQDVFETLRNRMLATASLLTIPPSRDDVYDTVKKCKDLYWIEEASFYEGGAGMLCIDSHVIAIVEDKDLASCIAEAHLKARPPAVNQQELMDAVLCACIGCETAIQVKASSCICDIDWPNPSHKWMSPEQWEQFTSAAELGEDFFADAASEYGSYRVNIPLFVFIRCADEGEYAHFWRLAFDERQGFHYTLECE